VSFKVDTLFSDRYDNGTLIGLRPSTQFSPGGPALITHCGPLASVSPNLIHGNSKTEAAGVRSAPDKRLHRSEWTEHTKDLLARSVVVDSSDANSIEPSRAAKDCGGLTEARRAREAPIGSGQGQCRPAGLALRKTRGVGTTQDGPADCRTSARATRPRAAVTDSGCHLPYKRLSLFGRPVLETAVRPLKRLD
jgi:hypothetical protein